MPPKKKIVKKPFIRTAAEAIGTALGKLAIKTHVVSPEVNSLERPKSSGSKKKAASRQRVKAPTKKPTH